MFSWKREIKITFSEAIETEENFFPQKSASWCDQLNEVVNKLTRKLFLAKFPFWEFYVCITGPGVICFTFVVYTSLLVISWFWRNLLGCLLFWAPTCFLMVVLLCYFLLSFSWEMAKPSTDFQTITIWVVSLDY